MPVCIFAIKTDKLTSAHTIFFPHFLFKFVQSYPVLLVQAAFSNVSLCSIQLIMGRHRRVHA